jgi:hypothetical protein
MHVRTHTWCTGAAVKQNVVNECPSARNRRRSGHRPSEMFSSTVKQLKDDWLAFGWYTIGD